MNAPASFAPVDRQLEAIRRGAEEIFPEDDLVRKLARACETGRPLRIKLGVDPTTADLHLGHTVVLRKMRQFQDLGHLAVLIIGNATARVGDPSGRNATRPTIEADEVERNAATYLAQAGKVLDMDPQRLLIVSNAEWFDGFPFMRAVGWAQHLTVARILERNDFMERYRAGNPIGLHEFLYPLMQAYDSVEVKADVELGGRDQTFNLLVGRDLQRADGQEPQVCLTMPILVGMDGERKMSKTYGNAIGITDDPKAMFDHVLSIPDPVVEGWFTLLTDAPLDEVRALVAPDGDIQAAKERLALAIVRSCHGEAATAPLGRGKAVAIDVRLDLEGLREGDGTIAALRLLTAGKSIANSHADARRLIEERRVALNGKPIDSPAERLVVADGDIITRGRKSFRLVTR